MQGPCILNLPKSWPTPWAMKQNNRTIIAGLSLLSLGAAALLSGCGWFDGGAAPSHLQGARPGADRTAPVLKALPPPDSARPHETGVAPADETRSGAAVGSTVSGTGGQKVQKEEAGKQADEQSRKAREARERAAREAAARKIAPPVEAPPAEQPPPPSPPSSPSSSKD